MKMIACLFGRKFDAKCKVWIKRTMDRTKVLRQRRKAMEKFLTDDIAELLSRGLDTHAYSKAEELFANENQISCYNLIDDFCERIFGHLSSMQKKRECPEQCEEAVSSLIFAAARIARAPELLKLRNILKKRYENLPESSVNEEFAAEFELKSPSMETKLQLLGDIAQKYDIIWDSRDLEQQVSHVPPAPR